ncbi:MAG: Prolipoprotein diacylglyceryl transferase [Phycisphaerae bacterium]|nr:Prolipoprotein diacylglyceryl transferase [Phycisphaerae bacterium]
MRYILFDLPWLSIPVMGYGLMIVLGFGTGILMAYRRAKRFGENPEHIVNLGLLALIGGITGARGLYVILNFGDFTGYGFWGDVGRMVNVRAGGLVYYGGLLLALVLGIGYILRKRLSVRRVLDIAAPSLMIGLAFGRIGCTLNGCCFGGRCTLDWAPTISFPYGSPSYSQHATGMAWRIVGDDGTPLADADGHERFVVPEERKDASNTAYTVHADAPPGTRPDGPVLDVPRQFLVAHDMGPGQPALYELLDRETIHKEGRLNQTYHYRDVPVHPTQLYSALNALLICILLNLFYANRRREGQVFALMLTLYPVSRFILEAIRKDTLPVLYGLSFSQVVSIGLLALGLLVWRLAARLPAVAPVPLSGRSAAAGD